MTTNTVVNSGSKQAYGQAKETYGSDRGGVAPVSRLRKKAATTTTHAASTSVPRSSKRTPHVEVQAASTTGDIPVMEKHENGDVTFHLHGYPAVRCEKIAGSSDDAQASSYRTKMSDEARINEDIRRVSMVMKQLQKMIDTY